MLPVQTGAVEARGDLPLPGAVDVASLRFHLGSPENFGVQGTRPTHPRLLDWLARDLVSSDWDVKRALKQIVLSATYRQDSVASAELRERDPANELLARGPRRRLSAEMLRDTALAASGLLDESRGGPPVNPYQPAGLWRESVRLTGVDLPS